MLELKEEILKLLAFNNFLSYDDIKLELKTNDDELVNALDELEKEYIIHKSKKNKFGLLESFNLYVGKIQLKKQGYGFFSSLKLNDDVFIPIDELDNALDGDTVLAWVEPTLNDSNKRKEGSVVEVIKHNNNLICEIYYDEYTNKKKIYCKTYPYVIINVDYKIYVPGDVVLVKVNDVDLIKRNTIYGEIIESLGNSNDVGIDVKAVCYQYGITPEFSSEVIKNIEDINNAYLLNKDVEISKRKRINKTIITIDGEDAKDLDDAISLEKLGNGNYLLGVYIADVSYFVTKDSEVDKEALNRGTSVYLTDRVVPMLPHKLCNDLCSLNEKEDKLAIACEMEINNQGSVMNSDIFECVISSKHRMTYTIVNKIIDDEIDDNIKSEYSDVIDMIKNMNNLSHILNGMRERRGSLTFDIPEAKIIVDEKGTPIDVIKCERGEGEKLIEEFMLIANETVAQTITNMSLPFIYRVHDEPNSLKLEKFKRVLKNTNYKINSKSKNINALALQNLLNQINSEDSMISTMLLRLMAKAKYSNINIGHFGLASSCYTHFTSPIRRYPDLLVHRLLRLYLFNNDFYTNYDNKYEIDLSNEIASIAELSSEKEVNATMCEYEVEDMKKAEYMENHLLETYQGKITSVTNFGFFVTLDNTIEGLVHVKSLRDDYYEYNDFKMAIIGKRTNKIYKLGDKLTIKVVGASKEDKAIDFEVINVSAGKNKASMLKYSQVKYSGKKNGKTGRNKNRRKK